MELRCLGSSLLKLRPSPFLLFLTPSPATSRFFVVAGNPPDPAFFNLINSQRSALSTCGSVVQAPAGAAASSPKPESDSNESPLRRPAPPFVGSRDDVKHQEVRQLIDEIGIPKATKSRKYPSVPTSQQSGGRRPLSALDVVKDAFSYRSPPPMQSAYLPGAIHNQMNIPEQPGSSGAQDGASLAYRRGVRAPLKRSVKPRAVRTIESSPRVGRTIEINLKRGLDLPRALRKLGFQCIENNVRRDQLNQRYYERPGMKRKRLKRERWRARFKLGFKALVQKVQAMRRKGW